MIGSIADICRSLLLTEFGRASSIRLLEEARAGDDGAVDRLYRRYLSPLQRWARGRLPGWARDVMDTDDLVQETLLHTLHRLDPFEARRSGAFQAYLRRAVLNRIRDEIRRHQRRPAAEAGASGAQDGRPSPLEEAIGRELVECYETALTRLRPADREAVLARVELGFSYEQVAISLDKPSPDAARMAVTRALARLAEEMSRGVG